MKRLKLLTRPFLEFMISRVPQSLLRKTEDVSQYFQGKGWGAATVEAELKAIKDFVLKKDLTNLTVIDAGANVGNWADSALRHLPVSRIFCFEPSKTAFENLTARFEGNRNVLCVNLGLSDQNRQVTLFSDVKGSGLSSVYSRRVEHFGIKFDSKEDIEVITLDSWIGDQPEKIEPSILKLDVEGHELAVLVGAIKTIKNLQIIQFEFGGGNIDSKTYFQDFWYFFARHNFDVYRIIPRGTARISEYSEILEVFRTTNYVAVRR
jgi:FkbM family methyltransferase